ncbi:hypothetical protein OKW49_008083 [Paraburkholderia youngii]
MNYSGIDLQSNNSVVTVIDQADRVMAEKRLPNDLAKILAFLAPWQPDAVWTVGPWVTARRKVKTTPKTARSICRRPPSPICS